MATYLMCFGTNSIRNGKYLTAAAFRSGYSINRKIITGTTVRSPLRVVSAGDAKNFGTFSSASKQRLHSQPLRKNPNDSSSGTDVQKKKYEKPALSPPDPSEFPAWAYEERDFFRFELLHESKISDARVGRIHTPHGIIDTPGFVAVATNGAFKGLDFRDADDAGQQLVFCNSYHLLLQPGPDIIAEAGGLHKFINREDRPLITDSGGFQVFSLAYGSVQEELSSKGELKRASSSKHNSNTNSAEVKHPVTVTEEGVTFRSYRDGRKIFLTPETTVQAQKAYGADIIIPLDELPPYHIDRQRLVDSVDLTHRWEARSLQEHLKDVKKQAMFAVIHGGLDEELRKKSVNYLTSLPFDGYSIGGSLGKSHQDLIDLLTWMMPMFNEGHRKNKPRHLLGIADEENIVKAVPLGIDTLDSCYPIRLSRHGTLLTRQGKLHIRKCKNSHNEKIDEECACSTCQNYDRAYLCHLFKSSEPLFLKLAAVHNVQYMNDLMAQMRQDIYDDKI